MTNHVICRELKTGKINTLPNTLHWMFPNSMCSDLHYKLLGPRDEQAGNGVHYGNDVF